MLITRRYHYHHTLNRSWRELVYKLVQGCRDAGVWGHRGAGAQGCRGEGCRGAGSPLMPPGGLRRAARSVQRCRAGTLPEHVQGLQHVARPPYGIAQGWQGVPMPGPAQHPICVWAANSLHAHPALMHMLHLVHVHTRLVLAPRHSLVDTAAMMCCPWKYSVSHSSCWDVPRAGDSP